MHEDNISNPVELKNGGLYTPITRAPKPIDKFMNHNNEGICIRPESEPIPDSEETLMIFEEIFGPGVTPDNNTLYQIYQEDLANFDYQCLRKLRDCEYGTVLNRTTYDRAVMDSQLDRGASRSDTYNNLLGAVSDQATVLDGLNQNTKNIDELNTDNGAVKVGDDEDVGAVMAKMMAKNQPKTPHWKETQSQEDREERLEKARLKRERKKAARERDESNREKG